MDPRKMKYPVLLLNSSNNPTSEWREGTEWEEALQLIMKCAGCAQNNKMAVVYHVVPDYDAGWMYS